MLRLHLKVACVLLAAGSARAAPLPSCEEDTEAHCLGEDADLSPEGISACLAGLSDDQRTDRCRSYMSLMAGCAEDVSRDGICGSAHAEGEGVPCLLQRVKPEQLSAACQAALPSEDLKGLAKYWKEGKRHLVIDEIADLNADDKDTYNRWVSKKKKKAGSSSAKDKDRDYAVRKAKKQRATELIAAAAREAMAADAAPTVEACVGLARKEAEKAVSDDMTGTLKPFAKSELTDICKEAVKAAKAKGGKAEL